jgi:hypothetical protein
MNALQKLFRPATKAPSREITLTDSISIAGIHHEAGEVLRLDTATAEMLCAEGQAVDPLAEAAGKAKALQIETSLPAPIQQQALPESWDTLPPCFETWWKLDQARNALVARRAAIQAKLVKVRSPWVLDADFSSLKTSAPHHERTMVQRLAGNVMIGETPPDTLREIRFLEDALARAGQAVEAWLEDNRDEYIRAKIECGDNVQQECELVGRAVVKLHELGFEIFSTRISALGLAETHNRRLFGGSSDAVKYSQLQPPALDELVLGWQEEGQDPRLILEKPVPVMAHLLASYANLAAEVDILTAQAEKELAAARKVTAKAA